MLEPGSRLGYIDMILQKFLVFAAKKLPLSIKMIISAKKKVWHDDLWLQLFQIQNGAQAPDMVRLTFFLWEITQKFFFLAWGFHILATRKNNFCHPGGSQWGPGGFLARFRAKNGYFWTNFQKNQCFIVF